MGKYTSADIKRIANAMRRQKGNVPDRPYSLLIGAGCSRTAGIPLASELVQEIKRDYEHEIAHRRGKDCDDDYGACMAVLSADEIRAVLTPHLEGAGVNWGHIAIAALMDAGYVSRVLTFNFDSVLARACGLLGLYPATYDFATGAPTRTNYIVSPAILHLHGQGHGHALLNSEDETYDHARALRLLLTDTLSHYPLLVAGYSGESDAVFAVLKDLFEGEQRLCWAGYETDCPAHVR
ncbi:MAG: SIR2 family protein, partial [Pseudomonadota bacterium]